MENFKYTLTHLLCRPNPDDANSVVFDCPKDFILLDSVKVQGASLSPINNLPLSVEFNPFYITLPYVDISQYLSSPGTSIAYHKMPLEQGETQFIVALLKNY